MPTTETLVANGFSFGFTRHYDILGNPSSLVYPDGAAMNYWPNALGQPTRVANYATGITYHPNGAVAGFSYGNGGTHSQTLNTRQLPLRRRDTRPGSTYLDYNYVYDQNGNLKELWDNRVPNDESRFMAYDSVDRLIQADALDVLGPESFTYDPLDNLRSLDYPGRADLFLDYTYDATHSRLIRIDASTSTGGSAFHNYSYDTRGNMLSGMAPGFVDRAHAFDKANRMLWASTNGQYESFRYDGHRRRTTITRTGGTTSQVYGRDGKFLYERSPSGTTTRHIHLGNRLLVSVTGTTPTYAHTDHLGSVVRESNAAGVQVDSVVYAPYGSVQAGTLNQGPGFTGHVNDAASGLVYMQQRYHDPIAMRFISVDPVRPSTTDGGNFNRYWYANNNPYNYVDPDGRFGVGMDLFRKDLSRSEVMQLHEARMGSAVAGATAVTVGGTMAVGGVSLATSNAARGSPLPFRVKPRSSQQQSVERPARQGISRLRLL